MSPLAQVVHEEPQHVAVKEFSVSQAVFIPFPLVPLDHLWREGGRGRSGERNQSKKGAKQGRSKGRAVLERRARESRPSWPQGGSRSVRGAGPYLRQTR